jgi:hypothetical protein
MLSTERGAERSYHELLVRSETGIGSEQAVRHEPAPKAEAAVTR